MLRHIRVNQTYWFCRHCWQEMPDYSHMQLGLSPASHLSTSSLVEAAGLKKRQRSFMTVM
ncbi:MAG TPA: hypothetical protein V6C88_14335 [Chroococcidiopsis sp.]